MRLEAAAVTIRGFLLADVLADLLQLEAHCGHGVPTGPKVLAREIPFLAAQVHAISSRSSFLTIRRIG